METVNRSAALAEFDSTIWAMEPQALRNMRDALERGPEMISAATPGNRRSDPIASDGKFIAVLPISGPISDKPTLWTAIFGGTVLSQWLENFNAAVANPRIHGIVLDVNSPGGSVAGVTEAASQIRQARDRKPIFAVSNSLMASAAYALGSQAHKVLTLRSGMTGSIGTYSLHLDHSRALDKAGITPTFIYAGERKVDGSPYLPLSDRAKADEQGIVNFYFRQFIQDVAAGRGLEEDWVRSRMADGRVHTSDTAYVLRFVNGTVSGLPQAVEQVAGTTAGRLAAAWTQFRVEEAIDPGGIERARNMKLRAELALLDCN